jgi:hypothetical protein
VNAKDRDGKLTDDIKLIADDVTIVTPQELEAYKATGRSMKVPKAGAKSLATNVGEGDVKITYRPVETISTNLNLPQDEPAKLPEPPKPRLYIHVKDPNNHDALVKLKQAFNSFPGGHEVVLVLGDEKKSAMRMPFTIEPHDDLQTAVATLLGPDCVALK